MPAPKKSNFELVKGNLLESGCEALVNAVNCVGVMGAGIARAFRELDEEMFKSYALACKKEELKLGILHTYKNPETRPDVAKYVWIVNFPTMHFPGERAVLKDLESGFEALGEFVDEKKVKSIAIPALGCGIGGFTWAEFLPLVEAWAKKHPKCQVKAYQPL